MTKLLLCLFCAFALAVATIQLRQQELELKNRAAKLQQDIEGQQAKLWSQQLQIATYTAPNVISKTVGRQGLDLVPEKLPAQSAKNDARQTPADGSGL
jgi:cell division protein FtsL